MDVRQLKTAQENKPLKITNQNQKEESMPITKFYHQNNLQVKQHLNNPV
jgi:hypothetical protein